MEENKNLVIAYSYYVNKEGSEEKEITKRIHDLMAGVPTDEVVKEVKGLVHQQHALMQNRRVWVRKEYPEFVIEDFKSKEELFNFIDEDEPNIYLQSEIRFVNIPKFLESIGMYSTESAHDYEIECKEYIEAKHERMREEGK